MDTNTIIVCSVCTGFVLGALVVAIVYHFKLTKLKEELESLKKRYSLQQRVRNSLGGN